MDVKPLTTSKITNILSNDPFSKSCFIGVFPRDKLPELTSYPTCFVVNTDPSYKVGEHWLGMYFDRYRKCYFFDSFRNEPDYFKLDQFVNKNSVEVESNYYQIQDFFSNTCGHYTVFFILLITRGFSLKEILSCFNLKKFDLNDFNFFSEIIK